MFEWTYDERALRNDPEANSGRSYRQCSQTVMDTILDPNITFDDDGRSNYCSEYAERAHQDLYLGDSGQAKVEEMMATLRGARTARSPYDCMIGLSGGIDSSYIVWLAKQWDLRPLVMHFDYGWNLQLAVQNIERTLKATGFDLYTHVIEWDDFRYLQRAYIRAGVLDLDVPADHLIFASMHQVARKFNIRYVLSGDNIQTEGILPKTWNYRGKLDLVNMLDIYAQFGEKPLGKLPRLGFWQRLYYNYAFRIQKFAPLNYVVYDSRQVKQTLAEKLGWVDYGSKHFENIFTRFYQGYILPTRFGIDKRKAHLSTLICSGQLSRSQALEELEKPPYSLETMAQDYEYVCKKLGFSESEFEACLKGPKRRHSDFKEDVQYQGLRRFAKKLLGRS